MTWANDPRCARCGRGGKLTVTRAGRLCGRCVSKIPRNLVRPPPEPPALGTAPDLPAPADGGRHAIGRQQSVDYWCQYCGLSGRGQVGWPGQRCCPECDAGRDEDGETWKDRCACRLAGYPPDVWWPRAADQLRFKWFREVRGGRRPGPAPWMHLDLAALLRRSRSLRLDDRGWAMLEPKETTR